MDKVNSLVPVVELERIPALEGAESGTVFDAREYEQDRCELQRSTNSANDQLSLKPVHSGSLGMSDSDEDLPSCGLRVYEPKARTTQSPADYRRGLDEIINNHAKLRKEVDMARQCRRRIKQMEEAPAERLSTCLESELQSDGDSWFRCLYEASQWMAPCKTLIDVHPGLRVLDSAERGKLFTRESLTFEAMENPVSSVDFMLKTVSCDLIDEFIRAKSFQLYSRQLTDRRAAFRLLFRLISVHEDRSIVTKCRDLLLDLFKHHPADAGAIGFKEVLEVLVNCGIALEKLIPVPELLVLAEKISGMTAMQVEEARAKPSSSQEHRMECILRVLSYLVKRGLSETLFEPDHITVLVVALCSLAVDTTLRSSVVIVEIRSILGDLIYRFSEDGWADRVAALARHLSSLDNVPQNMAFVALLCCFSDRCRQLQQLTAFLMCHKLLGISPTDVRDEMPEAMLSLIQSMDKGVNDDLSILYNILVLVNLFLDRDAPECKWKVTQELFTIVRKIANNMKKKDNSRDWIKIRDMATSIYAKWTILGCLRPKSEKPLFEYSEENEEHWP